MKEWMYKKKGERWWRGFGGFKGIKRGNEGMENERMKGWKNEGMKKMKLKL